MKRFLKTLWHFLCATLFKEIGIVLGIVLGSILMIPIMIIVASPILFIVGSYASFLLYHVCKLSPPDGDFTILTVLAMGLWFSFMIGTVIAAGNYIIKWFKEDFIWKWEAAERKAEGY